MFKTIFLYINFIFSIINLINSIEKTKTLVVKINKNKEGLLAKNFDKKAKKIDYYHLLLFCQIFSGD